MSSVLLVDLESGSVGVALAQLHKTDKPRLSAEKRVHFPTLHRIHSDLLLTQTHKAASAALVHASEVATRLRSHPQTLAAGTISRADIFLSGPWAEVRFASAGNVKHHAHTAMTNLVRPMVAALFGDIPIAFHTFSNAAGFVANGIWGSEPYLLCTITGEMTEISARGPHGLLGHATFPTGHASLVRTLMTHANMSESEARSAMRLGGSHLSEVFASAAQHFTDEFHIVAQKLLTHTPARTVVVLAHEPHAEWFAKTLAESGAISALFVQAGTVRAMRAGPIAANLAAHAPKPDLFLAIETLFADNRYSV